MKSVNTNIDTSIDNSSNVNTGGNIINSVKPNAPINSSGNKDIKEPYAGYTYENDSYHYYDDDQDYYQEAKAGAAKQHDIIFFTPAQVMEIQQHLMLLIQIYHWF